MAATTTDQINALANDARCIDRCIPDGEKMSVLISLLYQFQQQGGGGGGVPALPDTQIFVGSASNVATAVAMSKDATIADTGAVTLSNNVTARSDIGLGTGNVATFQAVREAVSAIGGTNIDWSAAGLFTLTLSASITFTFSNIAAGQVIKVKILGDASHTVTWPAVLWPGGVAPTQTLSKTDTYTFISFDGTTVEGSAVQNMS